MILWLTESEQATLVDSIKDVVRSSVRQTPEEGRRTYQPKRCGNNNKYEDNSSKTFNDNNLAVNLKLDIFFENSREKYIWDFYWL